MNQGEASRENGHNRRLRARFPVQLPCRLENEECDIRDISYTGLRFFSETLLEPETSKALILPVTRRNGEKKDLEIEVIIRWCKESPGGGYEVGAEVSTISQDDEAEFIAFPGIVQEVLRRVKHQQSIRLLTAVFLGLLLTAGSVVGVLLWTGRHLKGLEELTLQRESERASIRERRERDFRRRIRGLTAQLARSNDSASTEARILRSNLKNLREALEENRRGFWAIAERNQKAVVLIQHAYQVFNPKTGRAVRIIGRQANGAPIFSEGPVGVPVTLRLQGTGFVIDHRGTILTGRHVAEPWRENDRLRSKGWSGRTVLLSAIFADTDRPLSAKVLKVSREVDAAALRIDPFPGMPVVQAIEPDPKKVRQGLRVAIIGFPSGVMMEGKAKTTLTTGVLSKVNLSKELQFDAPVNPGNSGGPIFNEQGHVIGIVHAVGVGPGGAKLHGISYGIPIRFAISLTEEPKKISRPESKISLESG